jgi:hypothetical protein
VSSVLALVSAVFGVCCLTALLTDGKTTQAPHSDIDAVAYFWEAFQHHPERRDEALARLTARALAADATDQEVLYTGLAHLWAVAEGGSASAPAQAHTHAVLAEHWLARAAAADPEDTRIAGWQASAAKAAADLLRDEAAREAAIARLETLAAQDPCFHSVPLAIVAFDLPRTDARFARALAAMNAGFDCGAQAGGQDRARWPHNVAGFLVALADYRLKAGDVDGAEMALVVAEARESTEHWPKRHLLTERLASLRTRAAQYADEDASNDPPFALQPGVLSCTACHAAQPPGAPAQR